MPTKLNECVACKKSDTIPENYHDLCNKCFDLFDWQKQRGLKNEEKNIKTVFYECSGEWAAMMHKKKLIV